MARKNYGTDMLISDQIQKRLELDISSSGKTNILKHYTNLNKIE
jgi:hypothetical protein